MIACKTIIGFGLPTKAGTQKAHSDAPGEEEIAGARKILGWDSPPFEIPEPLLREWRESRGLPRDPMAAYAASGYQQKIAEDRAGGAQLSWGA